ncbi:polar amino acid ABC transporter permease [Alkalihalobacillus alcalophilus ATCC 27647 = CGMCC 1.3604]|uniref:Amino acid ABC transporter permease n=1 Tax=Alkalihalobacillus alcalophilus ATCC 27647 = CGMCC 1.3604 TaxID=1218173 RepID=A0A094WKU1_ALKAL|nr:ABC transporter permease subunit [Alkalihalobacillus alcalophilus]KGA96568.1 amino acid ABC transporter permease [Alkalihalobacillus alcalophilus ATCC 27647 = CGMCC 1.3604]MED1563526.1 ABC transporter permease subunit [Alkalihalobacillus alcalophilus]THG91355.1 polar amino acid ABC transporter permease [Alkalihalobacillus alcalophilus ATCC 27647 = CGMCC 1.3604]
MAKVKVQPSVPLWRNRIVIRIFWQVLFLVAVILTAAYFINNAANGLSRAGLSFGFSFLSSTANFAIGDIIIDYSPADTYGRALLVGVVNTLRVAFVGIILTTILGVIIGICRLSSNWLVKTLSGAYVEIFRNTPVLVQIFFWYFAFFLTLPRLNETEPIFNVFYFSNRGFAFPWLEWNGSTLWLILLIGGVAIAYITRKVLLKKQIETGNRKYPLATGIGVFIVLCIIGLLSTGMGPWSITVPTIEGLGFSGGNRINPEFAAILCGLVFYTASYIAEIVRGGILSVSKGQIEAASALGLSSGKILRFVTFPQAIRTIIPPITSQYLGLTKNSSLAVAVGYFELYAIGGTIFNQTGKAVEIVIIWMVIYLSISLLTALIMNIYNHMTRLVER